MLKKYLSSLKSTYYFMISFGVIIGAIFPFYSYLFFGSKAFSPFYAIGCLTAGFLVGTFCYHIIKQVMRLYLEGQLETLARIAGKQERQAPGRGSDELQLLLDGYDALMNSVLGMVDNVSALIVEIVPVYQELSLTSRELEKGNERQVKEVRKTQNAAEGMHASFRKILSETEELTARTDAKASIATQMSTTTEGIAENIKEYSQAVRETSASVAEMAGAIREATSNMTELTDATEETSSSIIEISASIEQVRDSARRSSECSENVRLKAQEGMLSMEATRRAMVEIERANQESSACIGRLAEKTTQAGEILSVIQEVVQQTNLLSLNAFIIAAQAGERGSSFSVVAGEIKSLAQRTASSAMEIDQLIRDILKETATVRESVSEGTARVSEGVQKSELAAKALAKIEESAEEAYDMARKIAVATEEQAAGSRLITERIEKNLVRGRQIASAVQELERGTVHIVGALEQMKEFTQKITVSSQEHAKGNKLYLKGVIDDSEKAKRLSEESECQLKAAAEVEGFLKDAGLLIEANAEEAKRIAARLEAISRLTEQLVRELAPFRAVQAIEGAQP